MNYYINEKQVDYTIFSSYLLQVCKHIAFKELSSNYDFTTEKKLIKLAREYYFDYYDNMKNNGLIYTIEKITFKVLKGVK